MGEGWCGGDGGLEWRQGGDGGGGGSALIMHFCFIIL